MEDGSADATPAILERLQKEFSNLRVVRQSHSGASVALNRALGFCRTPLIVALGADNLLDPRACQLLREEAERRPEAALIYADYTVIGPNGALVREVRNPEPHDPVGQLLAMHDRLGGDTRHDFLPFGPLCSFGRKVFDLWAASTWTSGTPTTWISVCGWERSGPSPMCRSSCTATGGMGETWA